MTYIRDKRERDARLAVAMGWTEVEKAPFGEMEGKTPGEKKWAFVPFYHRDHDAKHALLVWLASDYPKWMMFQWKLNDIIEPPDYDENNYVFVIAYMLATPEAVAIAADEALREAGYYGDKEMRGTDE